MTFTRCSLAVCFATLVFCSLLQAQQSTPTSSSASVPRLVSFSGKTADPQGKPISGIVGITFAIYKDQYEGAPLWMETQNVQADAKGNYTAQLGASKPEGLPLELFSSGEARWLGVRVNAGEEQWRVLLLSVPYALKAADADTLGGKPLSAFQLVTPHSDRGGSKQTQPTAEQPNEIRCAGSAACKTSFIPQFSSNGGSAKVSNSIISQSGTNIAIAGSENVTGDINSGGNLSASGNVSANGNVGASTMTAGASGNTIVATMSGNTAQTAAVTGIATATGVGNTYGVAGYSSTGNGVGVFGQNGAGIGLYGYGNVAVWGESTGTNAGSDGVHGVAHGPASGVTGVNTDLSGVGVWGEGPGQAFFANGNVAQVRTGGGWVKGMVYVNGWQAPYNIVRCFNSTLVGADASTPPCGFNLTVNNFGAWIVDFGFQVNDRFVSATGFGNGLTLFNECTSEMTVLSDCSALTPNQVIVFAQDPGGSWNNSYFHLIIY